MSPARPDYQPPAGLLGALGDLVRTCKRCSRQYVASRSDSVWCSTACRTAAWRERRKARAQAAPPPPA